MSEKIFLYKYLKKKYALDLVQNGNIRIGTFEEYRNSENPERGDEKEGTLSQYTKLDKPLEVRRPDDLKGAFKELIHFSGKGEGKGKLILNFKQGVVNTKIPNAYLYCLTKEYSLNIMNEFETDCILNLTNPKKFFNLIHEALNQLNSPLNSKADSCQYLGHEFDYDSNHPDIFFLKDKSYSHQREYRMVSTFIRPNEKYDGMILSIPELVSYVTIIYTKP
jgi:hypothetical protein